MNFIKYKYMYRYIWVVLWLGLVSIFKPTRLGFKIDAEMG